MSFNADGPTEAFWAFIITSTPAGVAELADDIKTLLCGRWESFSFKYSQRATDDYRQASAENKGDPVEDNAESDEEEEEPVPKRGRGRKGAKSGGNKRVLGKKAKRRQEDEVGSADEGDPLTEITKVFIMHSPNFFIGLGKIRQALGPLSEFPGISINKYDPRKGFKISVSYDKVLEKYGVPRDLPKFKRDDGGGGDWARSGGPNYGGGGGSAGPSGYGKRAYNY